MKLTDYPNELPAITLDFLNSKQLDPRINFSRASDANTTPPIMEKVLAVLVDRSSVPRECP